MFLPIRYPFVVLGAISVMACFQSTSNGTNSEASSSDNALSSLGTSSQGQVSSSVLGSSTNGASSIGNSAASSSQGQSNSSSSQSTSSQGSLPSFQPCVVDVSQVGASCGPGNTTSCDGVDIAMNYAKYPNPYAFFTNSSDPGVTLLGGSACQTQGVTLTWNSQAEQCILNGQGYPMSATMNCSSGFYSDSVTATQYQQYVSKWYSIATTQAQQVYQAGSGANASVVSVKLEDGSTIQAALSMGHGVLDGKCGDAFLIQQQGKYVLLLQTDIRAWSLELSPGANTYLDVANVGGTCIIPQVRKISAAFVLNQF